MLNLQQVPTPKFTPIFRSFSHFETLLPTNLSTLPTQDELPSEDNVPMETEAHRLQMELLINPLRPWLTTLGGGYVNGNMFLYFSEAQLRGEDFLGPDVMIVLGVTSQTRKSWVVWHEGKGPEVVIELLSEKTAKQDKGKKKQAYQDQLKVAEYFWFDPWDPDDWAGFELVNGQYRQIVADAHSRLLSKQLGLTLVRWQGVYQGSQRTWLRWATLGGKLLPTDEELANQAERRARAETAARQEAERRAAEAEAEIARLKALLTSQAK